MTREQKIGAAVAALAVAALAAWYFSRPSSSSIPTAAAPAGASSRALTTAAELGAGVVSRVVVGTTPSGDPIFGSGGAADKAPGAAEARARLYAAAGTAASAKGAP